MLRSPSTAPDTVGLSLSSTETQAVSLSRSNGAVGVTAIAEWSGGIQDNPTSIVQQLARFLKANNVSARRIAVTLDTGALFTHVLPVPPGQADTLLRKYAQWDLAQFIPGSAEEYITDVHLLRNEDADAEERLLSVSVQRGFAREMQAALSAEGLALHVLDADHFSAEYLLTSHHPGGGTGRVLLLGLKRDRTDFSLLVDGRLTDYWTRGACTPELFQATVRERTVAPGFIERVYLYGPRTSATTTAALSLSGTPPLEVLNPFAQMEIVPGNPLAPHFLAMPHRFVPAVGAALRED